MAVNTILTLGSPIKDHLAPSILGPAVNSAATVGSSSVAGGLSKTAALVAGGSTKVLTGGGSSMSLAAGGPGTAAVLTGGSTGAGTHTATQMAGIVLTKTATLVSVFVSLFFIAAAGAVGYLVYSIAKGMWELISKKIARA